MASRSIFSDYLDHTLGAVFIGLLMTVALYGVTCMQTLSYYRHNQRDGPSLKLFIFILWVLSTLHLCLIASTMYINLVTNFGNIGSSLKVAWMMAAMVIVSALIEFAVRCVFIIRIWKLSDQNRPIVVIAMILNLAVLGVASYFTWKALHTKFYSTLFDAHEWVMYAAFTLDSVVDIAITGSIALFLWRKRTGFASTDGVMMTMIKFAINTGVLTALISVMVLVTFLAIRHSYIFMTFYFLIAPIFHNSLLITLNARELMLETARGEAGKPASNSALAKLSNGMSQRGGGGEEYRLGRLDRSPTYVSQGKSANGESFIAVTVERTTYETTDVAAPIAARKSQRVSAK